MNWKKSDTCIKALISIPLVSQSKATKRANYYIRVVNWNQVLKFTVTLKKNEPHVINLSISMDEYLNRGLINQLTQLYLINMLIRSFDRLLFFFYDNTFNNPVWYINVSI